MLQDQQGYNRSCGMQPERTLLLLRARVSACRLWLGDSLRDG